MLTRGITPETISHFVSDINTTNKDNSTPTSDRSMPSRGSVLFVLGIAAARKQFIEYSICSVVGLFLLLFTTNAFVAKYYPAPGYATCHFAVAPNALSGRGDVARVE